MKQHKDTLGAKQPGTVLAYAMMLLTWLLLYVLSATAPFHLMDNDQQRPAAYVLDVLLNGNWVVQEDDTFDITSKPPLYTWVVALLAWSTGYFNLWTLYLPGALAVLAIAILVYTLGRRRFGGWVGLAAAMSWLLSGVALKHCGLARTDALFGLLTFAAAMCAMAAARRGRGWFWVWLLITLATLTKGPLALALVLFGLPALYWENVTRRRADAEARLLSLGPWQTHAAGFAFFVVIAGGWLLSAYLVEGSRVIDKIIGRELVGHAISSDSNDASIGSNPFNTLAYFLTRSVPWSLLTLAALVRLAVGPTIRMRPASRFVLRFATCYLVLGLFLFSMSPHKRPDHLMPLLPAAHLLAGWEIARWWRPQFNARFAQWFLAGLAGYALIVLLTFQVFQRNNHATLRSQWAAEMAGKIADNGGRNFPIISYDMPYATQFKLGTFRHKVPYEVARDLLLQQEYAAFVVVRDGSHFWYLTGVSQLMHTPVESERTMLTVYANRQEFAYHDKMAMALGGLVVMTEHLVPTMSGDRHLRFNPTGPPGTITMHNYTEFTRRVTLRIGDGVLQRHTLAPGERVSVNHGGQPARGLTLTPRPN